MFSDRNVHFYFGYFIFSCNKNSFRQEQSYSKGAFDGVEPNFKVDGATESSGNIPKLNLIHGNRNNTPKMHFLSEKMPPVRKAQVGPSIRRCLIRK